MTSHSQDILWLDIHLPKLMSKNLEHNKRNVVQTRGWENDFVSSNLDRLGLTNIKFRAWLGNLMHMNLWDAFIHPCPNANPYLAAKPPLKLEYAWAISLPRKWWNKRIYNTIYVSVDGNLPTVWHTTDCNANMCRLDEASLLINMVFQPCLSIWGPEWWLCGGCLFDK